MTIRDEGPVHEGTGVRLTAEHAAELERLKRVRAALGTLPELAAPDGVWARIAERAEGGRRRAHVARWLAGAAIAATVTGVAMLVIARSPRPSGPSDAAPSTTVADGAVQNPLARPLVPPTYVALVEESARLDRLLARVPYQRPVMSAGTATTIVGLEDRIAFIDEQLTFGAARRLGLPQREALWRERVDLMGALVQVRFAQSQPIAF